MKNKLLSSIIISMFILVGCQKDERKSTSFGVFSFQDNLTVVMNGVIGSKTPENWESYIEEYPETKNVVMKDCPGSEDDEANLEAARMMRKSALSFHLPASAEIASGAVDLYLSGTKRTRESGSKVGVHSWSDGDNEATSFPVGHPNHLPYIDYYKEMGFSQKDAEDFYYFTINAAQASGIHWMSEAEILKYKIVTQ